MGQLLSRVRKKPSTDDVLKQLEKELQTLEENRRTTEQKKKRLVGTLIFYSIVLYTIAVLTIYFYWYSSNYQKRMLFAIPLVIFPFLMWGLKLSLQWIFRRRLESNLDKLTELNKRKRTILNEVKETETYSKAKEILEKYDPEFKKQLQMEKEAAEKAQELKNLRRRSLGPSAGMKPKPVPNNLRTQTPGRPNFPPLPNNGQLLIRPPGPPLPRPILPRESGVFDKFVDYLIGDGPANRFALICHQCFSHNGMAMKEEFEYIAFRCCYCYSLNPAKKIRPYAPRLPVLEPIMPETLADGARESVSSTVSEDKSFIETEDSKESALSIQSDIVEEEDFPDEKVSDQNVTNENNEITKENLEENNEMNKKDR